MLLIKEGNTFNIPIETYLCDADADFANIPSNAPSGSIAYILNSNGNVVRKVKNSSGNWVEAEIIENYPTDFTEPITVLTPTTDYNPATKKYVDEALGQIIQIDYVVVQELPLTGEKGIIYLVPDNQGADNIYDEYLWITDKFEKIGSTQVDLSGYIPVVTGANNKIPKFNSDGRLVSTGFELGTNVPAAAVFTDTTYTLTQDQVDGHKITFTPSTGNATTITIPDNNTTYEDATQSVHGLMSASDKTKLDGINIANYIPIVTNETGEIPKFKADGTLESTGFTLGKSVPSNAVFTDTTYNNATTSVAGLMSASDKTKVDNLDNTYLKKTDLVTLTEQSYEALQEKTAPYYFIIEE